ncbi:hypothetical protein [Streptomyces sp. DH8]|uniref:hypothetical protein n=1 Tax=Streptomyces sp. DH8 TaxID=2857008 RepID=UPI001E3F4FD6|nr:hypothetical protein [Streptomyces sp. DH8]
MTTTEPVYDPADPQSGRALVNYHLVQLGIGERWVYGVSEHGQRTARHVVPADVGVCRAYVLTEAAWPDGAELCVTVSWTPDMALRRDYQKGKLPAGAPEHWQERVAATARALESLGYVVEPSRWSSPHYHHDAELLVYRLREGVTPRETPPDAAWALSKPVPPNHQERIWRYADRSPEDVVRDVVRKAGWRWLDDDPQAPNGRVGAHPITQMVWPPEADRCTWVTWWPAAAFARSTETGLLPAGAEDHWRDCLDRLRTVLIDGGLHIRSRDRPWGPGDEAAEFLVYRLAPRD